MKRVITTVALAAAMLLATATAALAAQGDGPTCSGTLGIANHGVHVRDAYVNSDPSVPGGPAAHGHFLAVDDDGNPAPVAPGASFCTGSQSPGLHLLGD